MDNLKIIAKYTKKCHDGSNCTYGNGFKIMNK